VTEFAGVRVVGVLSDTHGTLHLGVLPAFRDAEVELILHAGDVGSSSVLRALEALAPVVAVRGNVDTVGEVGGLPAEVRLNVGGLTIYITHVGLPPWVWQSRLEEPRSDVVIYGHSHIALIETQVKTLFLNPGSAGTRPRFGGGLSAAILTIDGRSADATPIVLQEAKKS
jgi:putative phosphoesterase